MCSYQIFQDVGVGVLSGTVDTLTESSPYAGDTTQTWPLDEMHYSCEQPLTLTYVLRDMWGSSSFVGTDYGGQHSANAITQGTDQEDPSEDYYGTTDPTATDATGSTCADSEGNLVDCSADGAVHVSGILGDGCPDTACGVVNAVTSGALSLSVFNQSLARILYQEERFGMLGCDNDSATCENPGGVEGDRSGDAALTTGDTSGDIVVGTKNGDANIVEQMAEEGAVLLKNDNSTLPIDKSDLKGGVAVSGPGAEYLIANPNAEGALGFDDRSAINPLQQLQSLSGSASAFTYSPANGPTGAVVPATVLSTSDTTVTGGLTRASGIGAGMVDQTLDFTSGSTNGQLAAGNYTWTGYVYVPSDDTYTFRFQHSSTIGTSGITLSVDGVAQTVSGATSFYNGLYGRGDATMVDVATTRTGYVESGLTNDQVPSAILTAGYHKVELTVDNSTSVSSFRFAYSRTQGDIDDAAAAAKGKSMAIVFVHDNGVTTIGGPNAASTDTTIPSLPDDQVALINAVASVNSNTVVVLNTGQSVITSTWANNSNIKSILEMWNPGQEGGTATARLLLGQANPSGHTTTTWAVNATDTIYSYDQQTTLYDGDTTGTHPERLGVDGETTMTQGIYSGYRYYDQLGIEVQYPFGYGLSYTDFSYSKLSVKRASDGGLDVSIKVKNTGSREGSAVPQVYLGEPSTQPDGIQFAERSLVQFEKVSLKANESKTVTMHVSLRSLQYWDSASQSWTLATGSRTVYVGDSDSLSDLTAKTNITIKNANDVVCSNQQLSSTTVTGDLIVPSGSWCDVVDVVVQGDLRMSGSGLRVQDTTVEGDLVATKTTGAEDPMSYGENVICSSTINGKVAITGSSSEAPWILGGCGSNTIGKSITFNHNSAPDNAINHNRVGESITCDSNGGMSSSDNAVQGDRKGECRQ